MQSDLPLPSQERGPGGEVVTPLAELRPRRIAVIKPSALGDVVHAMPAVGALRLRFPDARISWIVNRAYEPLVAGHPAIDETIPFDRGAMKRGVGATLAVMGRLIKELRHRRFDLAIDLQGLLRSGLMTLGTGARRRVGLSTAREGSRHCFTDIVTVPDADDAHAVDHSWSVAEAFGVGGVPKRFRVPVQPAARAWAAEALAGLPRPWLAVGPGSRWLTKRWPVEHFAELGRRAQARFGGSVVLIGTPDEAELARRVAEQVSGPCRDFCGRTTLAQLVALLDRADAVLANDTGPLHVAVGLGRPVAAPYTCTRVVRHGPFGQFASAAATGVWCAGSYVRSCDRLDCMTDLGPDTLWPALAAALSSWASASRSA